MTDREPGAPDDALPAEDTNGEPFPDEEPAGDDGGPTKGREDRPRTPRSR